MSNRVLIVGAGFSGAVCARQLAEAGIPSLVIEQRPHVGGNCHTARDAETGILVHRYGPHIFNTDYEEVWRYIRRFGKFGPFVNRVKATTSRGVFSLPINLHTLNQFFGKTLRPHEARAFLDSLGDKSITDPKNFEEQALRSLGRELYETFFYGYTRKQWGVEPTELPASLLKRLPVRFNYNDSYYDKKYQGIPVDGYTALIERILDHPGIELRLNASFEHGMRREFRHCVYTGPLDRFFDYAEGRLGYRTVYWEDERSRGDLQGVAAMNYPELQPPYTRIIEHKHFAPWESHDTTIASYEFSKETGEGDIPFYPKRLKNDKVLLATYQTLAENTPGVTLLGRLGTYRYLDMDLTIKEALDAAKTLAGNSGVTF